MLKLVRLNEDLRSKKGLVSFLVLLQPLFAIMQEIILNVFEFPESISQTFLVSSTAITLTIAMSLCFKRNSKLFVVVYFITILILLITAVLFPRNIDPMLAESTKFTLPVVIPSALCIIIYCNTKIIYESLFIISWLIVGLMLFYVTMYILGHAIITGYDMYISYSLLLPALALYSKKSLLSITASVFLFLCILLMGSRGALVSIFAFLIFDFLLFQKKWFFIYIPLVLFLFANLEIIYDLAENLGVNSRSLDFFAKGAIASSESRDALRKLFMKLLEENYVLGIGVWGDRLYAAYCHNIVLEIMLDFGIFIGSIILLLFLILFTKALIKSNKDNVLLLLVFFCACILPLFLSHSYLTDYKFGLFIGVLVICLKELTCAKIETNA